MPGLKRGWWVWLSLLLGSLLIGIGLLAPVFGLDAEAGFGPRRWAAIALGGVILVWVVSYPLFRWAQSQLAARRRRVAGHNGTSGQQFETVETPRAAQIPPRFPWVARHAPDLVFAAALIVGMWAALWVFTAGKMTASPPGTGYTSLLGEAFRSGQLHLLIEPDAKLAALENPYDLRQRRNIPVLWDASYYNGKYYLYWGAVPGVIAAALESLAPVQVRDPQLVLFFVLGTILFSLLFLRTVWRGVGHHLSTWLLLGGMLALAVNAPLIWLLTRPSVYEVAIAGGQCFLMAGLFFTFSGLTGSRRSIGWFLLAGIAWALAVGTRANLLLPIAFLSGMLLWRIYQSVHREPRKSAPGGLALAFPLLLGAACVAWYNHARFGSILESGHRYQLTGLALPEDYGLVTSLGYVLPNLYSYLARLPLFEARFPFISVLWVKEGAWPGFIPLPETYYYTEPVAGLLYLVPLIGLAALVALGWFYLVFHGALVSKPQPESTDRAWLGWLTIWLGGAALLELLVLLVFISGSLRYLADLASTWILLATVIFARAWSRLPRESWRRLFTIAWLVASGLTVLFGLLIGLTGYEGAFRELNPALYQRLIELFR
jgi:hypothetical protein